MTVETQNGNLSPVCVARTACTKTSITRGKQNSAGCSCQWLVLLISMGLVSCGGATNINLYLECPSPNHSVVAVLWSESGGGAAGWSQQLLSIQAADVPIEHTPDRRIRSESTVLAVNSGETYALKWQ